MELLWRVMTDGEWEYTTITGYPERGGLDKLISWMMEMEWEVVEGTRTPPQGKGSLGKGIPDGTIQMRRRKIRITHQVTLDEYED